MISLSYKYIRWGGGLGKREWGGDEKVELKTSGGAKEIPVPRTGRST
jgi:hypothetical protein